MEMNKRDTIASSAYYDHDEPSSTFNPYIGYTPPPVHHASHSSIGSTEPLLFAFWNTAQDAPAAPAAERPLSDDRLDPTLIDGALRDNIDYSRPILGIRNAASHES
jgi:hypothetical protein